MRGTLVPRTSVQATPQISSRVIRLTIENIPEDLEKALRSRARAEGKTLDELALEALRTAAASAAGVKKRDFTSVAGTWVDEPAFDEARRAHEQVDAGLGG